MNMIVKIITMIDKRGSLSTLFFRELRRRKIYLDYKF